MSKRTMPSGAVDYAFSETSVTPCFYIRAGNDSAVRLHYVGPGFLLMKHEHEHEGLRKGCDNVIDHFIHAEPWFRRRHMRPILRNTEVLGHGCSFRHIVVGDNSSKLIDYLMNLSPETASYQRYVRNGGVKVFEITIPVLTKDEISVFFEMVMRCFGGNTPACVTLSEITFDYLGLGWVIKRNQTRLNRTLME